MHSRYTTLIGAGNLAELIGAAPHSLLLLDCRFDLADPAAGARAYTTGHLPGALYMHIEQDLSGPKTGRNGRHPLPERAALARRLAALGLHQQQQVVAYDAQGGMFAARLWWLLRWLGHDSVALLDGGLQAWQELGQPLETATPTPQPGDFSAAAPLATTVDAATLERHLGKHERLVIDARAPDRYRGENETLDPVGGHIPGAVNRFYKDNLDATGRFKPAHTLRDEFTALLGQRGPESAVLQCGSGVTACHNALAMEVAGIHGAALYPGSWSEWCADPARPVATGAKP